MKKIIKSCLIILLFLLLTIAIFIYPTEVSYNKLINAGFILVVPFAIIDLGIYFWIRLSNGVDFKFNKILIIIISRLSQWILAGDIILMFVNLNKYYSKPLVCICSLLLIGLVSDDIINIVIKIINKVKEEVNYNRKAVKKD